MRKRSEAGAKAPKRREQEEEQRQARDYTIDVPNDPTNEQVVLAAMMVDTKLCDRLLTAFPAEAFYADEHRIIREGLAEMRRKKLTFDPATLSRLAPDADIRLLEQLPAARPDVPENIDYHVETLLWDYRRAQATRGPIATLLDVIQNPKEDPARVRAVARMVGQAFEGEVGRGRYLRDSKEIVRQMMKKLSARIEGEAIYPFGIEGLDYYENGEIRLRPGASPGTLTLVTALSGSGKSTFIAHLVIALANQGRKVLFGAWEENAPTTLESLTTLSLGWSRSRMLEGKSNSLRTEVMTPKEKIAFEEEAHRLAQFVVFFDNPFQRNARGGDEPSNDEHLDLIHEHIEDSGADVFTADLLARAMVDDRPSAEKHFLYRTVSILEECKVHGIFAHQQRAKDIETRANKAPTREGIIGSGAWLDTAWTILAPHLPAKWKKVDDNKFEIHILKQRNGPWPLGIEFDWNPDTGQISGGRDFDPKTTGETSGPEVPRHGINRQKGPFASKR